MTSAQTLAGQQAAFIAQVLDDETALPQGWGARQAAGMDIYRNAYRGRLVDALRETYERTARWVGEDAFRAAAAHHLITAPPSSWTLDDAGAGFDSVATELFADDREVGELAWLEWAMHRAFVARDVTPMDAAAFSGQTAAFSEGDWEKLTLTLLPAFQQRTVIYDVKAIWNAAATDDIEAVAYELAIPRECIVWREGFRGTFQLVEPLEGEALAAAADGRTFGAICALLAERIGPQEGVAAAGAMLGGWLNNGMIAQISVAGASAHA